MNWDGHKTMMRLVLAVQLSVAHTVAQLVGHMLKHSVTANILTTRHSAALAMALVSPMVYVAQLVMERGK